jgi:hypothetical protein
MLVYLADTVHTLGQLSPHTVPYNVARIAAYTQQQFPDHEYLLFKDPNALLEALRASRPSAGHVTLFLEHATQPSHRALRAVTLPRHHGRD